MQSMTGFAAVSGENDNFKWTAELRSVNGKGYDLKMKIPDWIDGLEVAVRNCLKQSVKRGNVTLTLKVQSDESDEDGSSFVDLIEVRKALQNINKIDQVAKEYGIPLSPSKATDLLLMKGITTSNDLSRAEAASLLKCILKSIETLNAQFIQSRTLEGKGLTEIITTQLCELSVLLTNAKELLPRRKTHVKQTLQLQLENILNSAEQIDAQRVAQEVALLHVKLDVTEELDRLAVHIKSAQDLLNSNGIVGRQLEFLMQEFNREVNTLCSKAQYSELTTIGLEMKVVIDQMREQVQNLE